VIRSGEDHSEPVAEGARDLQSEPVAQLATSDSHSESVAERSTSDQHSEPVAELSASPEAARDAEPVEDDIPSAEITVIDDSEVSPGDSTLEVDLKLVERAIAPSQAARRSTPPPPPPNGPSRRATSARRTGSVPPPLPPAAAAGRSELPVGPTPSPPPPVRTRKR
jgi:hypothetical protein